MTNTTLTANPVHIAGGMRLMARRLLTNIDPKTAHPTRLRQVADEAEALLVDARHLTCEDQHDKKLWRQINERRDQADRRESTSALAGAVAAGVLRGTLRVVDGAVVPR